MGASGGLERTLCNLSNEMVKRGHMVKIVTFDRNQGRPFYPLNESIEVINMQKETHRILSKTEKIQREIYRIFGRKTVRLWKEKNRNKDIPADFKHIAEQVQPDIIVSFNHETGGEIYKSGVKTPMISCFRNDPRILMDEMLDFEKQAIDKSVAIQILIPEFSKFIKQNFKSPNVVYIPNAVPQVQEIINLNQQKPIYKIVEVARLNRKQKRQQIIIKAFARIAQKYPQWIVELWGADTSGTGKLLKKLIKKYQLEDRVFLKGVTKDVETIYQSADIFAFPSIFEGFPNALAEAMTAGLPVIGCKICPSVTWLICSGENGILAEEDISDYAAQLEKLMSDRVLRIQLGKNAHNTMKAYDPKMIWDQWESLMKSVLKNRER